MRPFRLTVLLLLCLPPVVRAETPQPAPASGALPVPAKDYFSPTWALFISRRPGGTEGDPAANIEDSLRLHQEGLALYRQKKDPEAVAKYELALDHHATAELYYDYANSLSNVARLDDAIRAYDIALQLKPKRPELVLYNLACAHGRQNHVDLAYLYLAKAIDNGYNAIKHIQEDPDMANLRAQPDWQARIRKLVPPDIKFDRKSFVGVITEPDPRGENLYFLCSNGTVLIPFACAIGFSKGRWSVVNGGVHFAAASHCGPRPLGQCRTGGDACGVLNCEGWDVRPCEPSIGTLQDLDKSLLRDLVLPPGPPKQDASEAEKKASEDNDFWHLSHSPFKGGEPRQCREDFSPVTLHDYDLEPEAKTRGANGSDEATPKGTASPEWEGTLTWVWGMPTRMSHVLFHLCPGGRYVEHVSSGGYVRGRWGVDDGVFHLVPREVCVPAPKGACKKRVCESYEVQPCAPAKARAWKPTAIAVSVVRNARPADDDDEGGFHEKFKAGVPPQCADDFVPRSLADYDLSRFRPGKSTPDTGQQKSGPKAGQP